MGKALQWGADGRPEEGSYPVSLPGYLAGSGLDGSLTVSGTTTLTRDSFYTTLTIQTGATLKTAGFRVFARKIVIQGTGKLSADGQPGGAVNAWDGGVAVAASTISLGCTAGAGGTSNGSPPNASAGAGTTTYPNACGGVGGAGGAGGTNNIGATAAGGTAGAISSPEYFARPTRDFLRMATGIRGGTGAATGSSGVAATQYYGGASGGGGGGGNVLAVWCGELDISSAQAGAISAKGGISVASGSGISPTGGAGGSGGAGGGYIHGEIGFVTGTVSSVCDASGSPGITGANAIGSGCIGGQGGQGGAGGNIDIYVAAIDTWYSVRGSAGGALGSIPTNTTGSAGGAGGSCVLTL